MEEKAENFNSLRPILFELCKKKLQGGANWPDPPPPQGIGLKFTLSTLSRKLENKIELTQFGFNPVNTRSEMSFILFDAISSKIH